MKTLNFLYACNQRNTPFVLPFIWFARTFNPDSSFEIYITDGIIDQSFSKGILQLNTIFPDTPISISLNTQAIFPNKFRFLVESKIKSLYTYIGDIDIMICEPILPFHKARMGNSFIYDNEIRDSQDRMTGLHCVKTAEWYTQTREARRFLAQNQEIKTLNDEVMLLRLCQLSKIKLRPRVKLSGANRPTHGQHISLSRYPFSKMCQISNILDKHFEKPFLEQLQNPQFKQLLQYCPSFKKILDIYCAHCKISY